nr:hypothetical protein OG409_03590 [Streptomyces sp. NBC_00974]
MTAVLPASGVATGSGGASSAEHRDGAGADVAAPAALDLNRMTKQATAGGPYAPYYADHQRVHQFGWNGTGWQTATSPPAARRASASTPRASERRPDSLPASDRKPPCAE